MEYIAGFNMAGCLPDSTPDVCDTFDDAKKCVIGYLDWSIDNADQFGFVEKIEDEQSKVEQQTEPFSFRSADGFVYWVERIE